jgi:hypothetical protein
VTLRVRRDIPSLRTRRFLRELRPSLRRACERGEFRVVHYSVQRNHLHLLVESAGKAALGRGMKSIAARVARAAHRAFERAGSVLHGRYHLRILRRPQEVRRALVRGSRRAPGLGGGRRCSAGSGKPRAASGQSTPVTTRRVTAPDRSSR